MSLSMILTGLNGALGLYSGVKGVLDKNAASKKAKELRNRVRADEAGWYRRNYYESFLDSTAARAAMKRVENSLRRNNEQNRAHSVVVGATPEYSIARNEQGLRSMENMMTNLAAQDDSRKRQVDAIHQQNKNAFIADDFNQLSMDEKMATAAAKNGLNIFQNALLGANWGKE
ncbi:MAG: hypothetical protein J6Q73_03845 [Bacteroidaceae bacterium]|nr:hypothetical protein [Bacteroidaceae bacterium]